MNRLGRALVLTIVGLLIGCLAGCLERKERIIVSPEGATFIGVEFSGDSRAEVFDGDAPPSSESGWVGVRQRVEADKDGKETFILSAERTVAPGEALPDTFARPDDPDADLNLHFPTRVTREARADGLYYHFTRRYTRRDFAQIKALSDALVEAKIKDFSGKKLSEYTHDELVTAMRCFADFEVRKTLTFAEAAFHAVAPDAPQDQWLRAYGRVRSVRGGMDYDRLADAVRNEKDDDALSARLVSEGEAFDQRAMTALQESLRTDCGFGEARMSEFGRAFDREKKRYTITEDLGDESFEISVEMPGEIIGSNADSVEGRTATWEFDASLLRDRDLELMVSSRIGR